MPDYKNQKLRVLFFSYKYFYLMYKLTIIHPTTYRSSKVYHGLLGDIVACVKILVFTKYLGFNICLCLGCVLHRLCKRPSIQMR